MEKAQQTLRETARKLLADGKVEVVIGFEAGTVDGRARPVFVRDADDTDRLVWSQACSNNLTVYLAGMFRRKPVRRGQEPPPPPRVGIVVKGCDALSIALLVREKQVPRECLVVIGMPCQGIVDPKTGAVLPSCLDCAHPEAGGVDVKVEGTSRAPATDPHKHITEFEARPADERWQYFTEQMETCIRCNACRQACPNCYCNECFADQNDPKWMGTSVDLSEKMLYHLGRMFHQAGRCVACDACLRACPMGVDLRTFTHKLAQEAKQLYDFEISASPEDAPLFCTFKHEDSDAFITNPDATA